MPINHKYKLVFVHIPRTAGRSLICTLNMELPPGDKHEKVSWYKYYYPDYTTFTVIRSFKDRKKSAKNHWKWDDKFDYNNEWFIDKPVDYKLRYEHLQQDLNAMLADLNIKKRKLKRYNPDTGLC